MKSLHYNQLSNGWPSRTPRAALGALLCVMVLVTAGCQSPLRDAALQAGNAQNIVVMDFSEPMSVADLPPGWHHRRFFRTDPMQIDFGKKAGRPAIRLATANSASMLYRYTEIPLAGHRQLSWGWFIEQPVDSDVDETSEAGDDHPARLYLKFRTANGDTHAMEIIWGNKSLRAGDWKYLGEPDGARRFPHYVARGGTENVGRWHDEAVALDALFRQQWGDPAGATLIEVALFCDTDATGGKSLAWFSQVRLSR